MAYEALYRRYRPSTFADVAGQSHVISALRNAVEGDRVGHAYLFSGPRGTGKTTSARILAKALNCTNLQGGEPCDSCESCLSFQSGGSYDLHELDAASNNGVDAMRDLIGKVALGSPGRTKVYILDEVHMLSSGAENALLKTLEEPPSHVVFVLCTTEPNKVVPTIRSRTQHLEFSLLSTDEIGGLVDYVVSDAGLDITADDRNYVIRAGGGSARDTLSALDQVVAAGGAPQGGEHLDALFEALVQRDSGAALAAIDGAMHAGRDAATVATSLLHELRNVFLAAMRADLGHLPEAEREHATARAANMPPARVTRAIEVIGTSVIEMRQAPDPRVDLEVAIMRLTRRDLDVDPAALVERIEALEHQIAGGVVAAPAAAPAGAVPPAQATPSAQAAPAQAAPPAQDIAPEAAPQDMGHSQAEPPVEHAQAPPKQAPPPQQAPQPQQQAAPQGRGARGADIVRAALAEQGISQSKPAAAAPAATPAPADAPPPTTGKTLADIRRERQAAAQADGPSSEGGAPPPADVAANAEARRERQAAAQAPQEQAPPQQASREQAPPQQQAPQEQVPQQQPPQQAPQEQAPPQVPQQAPPQQQPPQHAPQESEPVPAPVDAEPLPAQQAAPAAGGGALPTVAQVEAMWPSALEGLSGVVRSRFSAGHFVESTGDALQFGLPNPVHRDRCQEVRAEVDAALAASFGFAVPLELVVDLTEVEPDFFNTPPSGGAGAVDHDETIREEDTVDVHDLVDATGDVPSAADRVMNTFPGSELLQDPSNQPHDR